MIDFFDFISDWLNSGVYGFFTEATAYAIEASVLLYFKKMAIMIPFAWGVAKTILADLNVSNHLNNAFAVLPPDIRSLAFFFNIPECLMTIASGFATKVVLRFLPSL